MDLHPSHIPPSPSSLQRLLSRVPPLLLLLLHLCIYGCVMLLVVLPALGLLPALEEQVRPAPGQTRLPARSPV